MGKEHQRYNKECPLLAPMAEEGWTDNEIAKLTIKEYLNDFPKLDALILGCTHYPLFEKIIKEQMPETDIINTGKIIAKYLEENIEKSENNMNIEEEIYLTDTECNFIQMANKILGHNVEIKEVEVK